MPHVDILLAIGTGIGLSAVAGVRAYLPLLLVGLAARLGLVTLPAAFSFLDSWPVLGVLLALALLESVLDKLPVFEKFLDLVQTPLRMVAGAVLFAVALGAGFGTGVVSALFAGGVLAGVVAFLKVSLRPPASASAAGVSPSFLSTVEDLLALAGGIVAVLVPVVALFLVAFLLFFYYRVRRRRGKKYGGLRILGD